MAYWGVAKTSSDRFTPIRLNTMGSDQIGI
jgi:hypothetical protein